jgi:hypothetical protein
LRYRDIDIINDKQFQKSNDTFKAVLVSLKGEGKAATKDKEIISDEDLKENIIIYTSRPMSFSKTALMFLQSMLTKISKIFSLINKFSMGDNFKNVSKLDLQTLVRNEFAKWRRYKHFNRKLKFLK